jgi:biotin synthase
MKFFKLPMKPESKSITNRNHVKVPEPVLSIDELLKMVAVSDERAVELFVLADRLRRRFKGSGVFTCGILNAKSGRCSENCAFCAQSVHHQTKIDLYPLLTKNQIVQKAKESAHNGALRFSIVTSGFQPTRAELDTIFEAVATISSQTDLEVCASLGTLTEEAAQSLYQSGVSNYHHNLETARSHFDQICTTHSYDDDMDTLIIAKKAGMRVCSGGIMGLGESWSQRIEMASTLRELDVDSIPVNFLNPISGTPLEQRPLLSPMTALKCIALFRVVNPQKDIVVCGGREVTLKDFQSWVFLAGASGLMVGNYLTTCGRSIATDMEMISQQGLRNRLPGRL